MSFGERLKEARLKNGLSQEQLAQLLNVEQKTISRWELGTREPSSLKMLKQIAVTLKCDPNYLLGFGE